MSPQTPLDLRVQITDAPIDTMPDAVEADCGALVTFCGVVRDHNCGRSVAGIEYQCYRAMAEREGARILEDIAGQFPVKTIRLVHRVGELSVGDVAMFAVVSAPHRREALAALDALIDRVKQDLPVWKRERYRDDTAAWL